MRNPIGIPFYGLCIPCLYYVLPGSYFPTGCSLCRKISAYTSAKRVLKSSVPRSPNVLASPVNILQTFVPQLFPLTHGLSRNLLVHLRCLWLRLPQYVCFCNFKWQIYNLDRHILKSGFLFELISVYIIFSTFPTMLPFILLSRSIICCHPE